jgi:hypothetical protein
MLFEFFHFVFGDEVSDDDEAVTPILAIFVNADLVSVSPLRRNHTIRHGISLLSSKV